MLETKIELQLDKRAIQHHIEKQLDEAIQAQLWMVDVNKLSELTCISKRYLEQEILSDVRFKAIERKKNSKRWYMAHEAFALVDEITSEW
ncbi:hypothetical protein [Lysinibacillus xylanilyticus]|uniref:hypothetical protein n=1 Tax=Lysinibacillus xylanilyticus TaxID=582475 RepID=UPI003CFE10CB